MANETNYEQRREALKERYLGDTTSDEGSMLTGGVDHLVLISADLDATIRFYTEVLGMRLTKVFQNRDDPTSTHIFLDMGGGNQLAFFDFPEHGTAPTQRGIGSMHHVALKAGSAQFQTLLKKLEAQQIQHSRHGSGDTGSVYLRDPDNVLVEVTTGYS